MCIFQSDAIASVPIYPNVESALLESVLEDHLLPEMDRCFIPRSHTTLQSMNRRNLA